MSTRKSASPQGDRFEALRRAQMAFDSLEQGKPIPNEARLPDNGGVPFKPAQVSVALDAAEGRVPGMIYSQPDKPPPAIARTWAGAAGHSIKVEAPTSSFDRLRMGQQRLGRSVERVSDGSAPERAPADGVKAKALERGVFSDIQREARLAHVSSLVDVIGGYYKSTRTELDSEKSRLASLSKDELESSIQAYEFSSNQVLVMTNQAHAQRAAMTSTKELRQFYEAHGTTEDMIESEAPRPASATPRRR